MVLIGKKERKGAREKRGSEGAGRGPEKKTGKKGERGREHLSLVWHECLLHISKQKHSQRSEMN